jgi:hypothetical protein
MSFTLMLQIMTLMAWAAFLATGLIHSYARMWADDDKGAKGEK